MEDRKSDGASINDGWQHPTLLPLCFHVCPPAAGSHSSLCAEVETEMDVTEVRLVTTDVSVEQRQKTSMEPQDEWSRINLTHGHSLSSSGTFVD